MAVRTTGVDRVAVARGAAVIVVILVPPVVFVRAMLGPESESPLWSLIPAAFLLSFAIGGAVTARRAAASPVKHAAIAGAIAFGLLLAVGVIRNLVTGRSMSVAALVTSVLFWQVAISLAAVGALFAGRRRAKEAAA